MWPGHKPGHERPHAWERRRPDRRLWIVATTQKHRSAGCCGSARLATVRLRVLLGQSSGRAAKSRLALRYHPIPEIGRFHLPFISFNAGSCASSPPATTVFEMLILGLYHLISGVAVVLKLTRSTKLSTRHRFHQRPSRVGRRCGYAISLRTPARHMLLRSCSIPERIRRLGATGSGHPVGRGAGRGGRRRRLRPRRTQQRRQGARPGGWRLQSRRCVRCLA